MKDNKIIQEYWFKKIDQYINTNDTCDGYEDIPSGNLFKEISGESLEGINILTKQNAIAEYTVYLSIFEGLIKRYTNQDTIWVASSTLNIEEVGCDKESLLFYSVDVANEETLRELIVATKAEIENTLTYSNIGFKNLKDRFESNSVCKEEYLQYGFNYNKVNHESEIIKEAKLFLNIEKGERGGIIIKVHYDVFKYSEVFIDNFINHYTSILENVDSYLSEKLIDIDILSGSEKEILLSFSQSSKNKKINESVIQNFHEQVKETPNNIALIHKEKKYTYSELNKEANRLAFILRERYDIKKGDVVGVMTDYSEHTIIAFIAILKLGASYLPLDHSAPDERLRYIISDTSPKAILIQLDYLNDVIEFNIPLFSIDVMLDEEVIGGYEDENIEESGDIAYIMYTSGSTGVPKGVVIENKGIVRLVKRTDYIQVNSNDRILGISNPVFDGSTFDIWGSLLNGATLCIPEKDLVLNFQLLAQEIITHEISVAFMTTVLFNSLVDSDVLEVGCLRKILFGGEKVSVSHVNKFIKRFGEGKLLHVYGPTENTTFSTCYHVNKSHTYTVPIGKPIGNTQCYILNENKALQPIGVSGELYVSGLGVAKGYLNKKELTDISFISNPFKEQSNLYKTGDICKWLPNGNIEFIGRRDSQVKIRGFRIELGEIKQKVIEFGNILETTIIVSNDSNNVKFLSAFVKGNEKVNIEELKRYLTQKLPDYMIPSHITQVDYMPLTRNGKIDEKKLLSLEKQKNKKNKNIVAPTTVTEGELLLIWQELFESSDISVEDDFFEIGGHSIKATHLVAMIHQKLNVKIKISNVFEDNTITKLARAIDRAKENHFTVIEPLPKQSSYEVSSSQRRLWALSQFQDANMAYTIPGTYFLEGVLDKLALERAFKFVVKRHESFRTLFQENEKGELRQIILSENDYDFKINHIDFPEKGSVKELEKIIKKLINVTFDLSNEPLLKVNLIKTEASEWVLVSVMHHIISDGLSMEVFIEELLLAYKAYKNNKEVELKPLRIQYKDYSAWLNKQTNDESLQNHKEFLVKKFEGELPILNLQNVNKRPKIKTYNGEALTINLDSISVSNFKKLLRDEELTLFMGLVTVVNVLLYKYTNQEDIVLGSQIAGRNHIDLEKQIGFYINVLPLRYKFSHNNSIIELFKIVKESTLESYEHDLYPFDRLVTDLNLNHDISRNPLFDITVVLQNADLDSKIDTLSDEGLKVSLYDKVKPEVSRFDVSFNFVESSDGIEFTIVYNSDIYNKEAINQIQEHFKNLIDSISSSPNTPIHSIPYLSIKEKEELTSVFSKGNTNGIVSTGIVEEFKRQVKKTPNNVALVHENIHLTYEELDKASNKIAHLLSTNYGVNKGDNVGIILDKSELLIISILGILKLGAVYVPIDIEIPKTRKKFIINDIAAKLIITQVDYMFDVDFFEGDMIAIDAQFPSLELEDKIFNVESSNEDLAYIMYTSGSTGDPKGALIKNKGVIRLVKNTSYIDFNSVDTILSTGAASFDATTFEFWGALLNGGKLVLCNKETVLDAKKMASIITTEKVDTMWFTSGLLNQLIDQDITLFKNLRNVLAGGDKLSPKHIRKLLETYPNLNIINGYGPTENTTFSTTFNIKDITDDDISIGKPIDNSQVYILDKDLNLCPKGVMGEICVGGDGLSVGYLNADELTREKFQYPSSIKEERVFKTGDLGIWLPNGDIKFVGRRDNQIKIRGYRVELNDIEKTLSKHPDVNLAVVVLNQVASPEEEKFIIAYVKGNKKVDKGSLKTYLRDNLPFYMIPSFFVEVDDFVLNKNGKIDRKALPIVDLNKLRSEIEYVSYRNDIEKIISEIWMSILDIEKVSVTEDFFEIGGHSLRAIKLANMINESFEMDMSIGHIFQFRTIEAMAKQLDFIIKQKKLENSKEQLQEIDIEL